MAIKKCTCKDKFQDETHGEGMRVVNECKGVKDAVQKKHRCTICLKEI